jgi:Na+:H+ antiporter, NhaA family
LALKRVQRFLALESAPGITLCAAAALALVLANSALGALYARLLDLPVAVQLGRLIIAKPLILWVNDGLMAVFFMLVGAELKREVIEGGLSKLSSAALPAIAAVGGMAGPALVFLAITAGTPGAARGWAVPTATDIAFAVGVLALLGPRVPPALKTFLLALAVIDDLGAIIIIAAFYTAHLSVIALALAGLGVAGLLILNLAGCPRLAPYMLLGVFVWVSVLKSGIHATLAGVIVGLLVPLSANDGASPLHRLEHDLQPWVAFGVLPVFAFANAGVGLAHIGPGDLVDPVQIGIFVGLLAGKPLGVLAAIWIPLRLGLARLPEGATWHLLWGIALLTGIGFTMSLFIGSLAFPADGYNPDVRLAVLLASLISGTAGYLVLRRAGQGRALGTHSL